MADSRPLSFTTAPRLLLLVLIGFLLIDHSPYAAEITREGLYGPGLPNFRIAGDIVTGDAERLSTAIKCGLNAFPCECAAYWDRGKSPPPDAGPRHLNVLGPLAPSGCSQTGSLVVISFNSNGGNAVEGMRLAQTIHGNLGITVVRKGDHCYSACALAFLGGFSVQLDVADPHPSRYLEPGASIGFHSISFENENQLNRIIGLENQQAEPFFDATRLSLAQLVSFLSKFGVSPWGIIDVVTASPKELKKIRTSRDLFNFRINTTPVSAPKLDEKEKILTACSFLISKMDNIDPTVEAVGPQNSVGILEYVPLLNVNDWLSQYAVGYRLRQRGWSHMLCGATLNASWPAIIGGKLLLPPDRPPPSSGEIQKLIAAGIANDNRGVDYAIYEEKEKRGNFTRALSFGGDSAFEPSGRGPDFSQSYESALPLTYLTIPPTVDIADYPTRLDKLWSMAR